MREALRAHCGSGTVAGVFLGVVAVLFARLARQPLPRYGGGAAQYIEHSYRVERAAMWRDGTWDSLWQFIVAADVPEGFAPMLHVMHVAVGAVLGHSVTDQGPAGIAWFLLFAGSLAWAALSLTRRKDVAAAALVGALLLPSAQGMGLRYYYDLPAAAVLWFALAVFAAGQDRHPLLSLVTGPLAGALVWTAGCIKWSMGPYAALMFPFAALVRRTDEARDWRRMAVRAVSLALAGAVAGWLMLQWIESGGGSHNETLASRSSSTGVWEQRVAFLPRTLQAVAARGMYEITHPDPVKWLWYPLAFVVTVLSPLWTATLAPLWAVALRKRPAGWRLAVGSTLALLAFVTFLLEVRDERFVIAIAGSLVLLAALGWGELSTLWKGRAAVVVVAAGAFVTLDAHLAPSAFWNHPVTVYPGRLGSDDGGDPGLPPLVARGLGLSDSVEGRGWSRSDTTPDSDIPFVEQVWADLERCGGPAIALSAHVLPNGSIEWLEYRAYLSYLQGDGWGPQIEVQWRMPEDLAPPEEPPPEDEVEEVHMPAGEPPPEPPPSFRAHVGTARLDKSGLPGEGWELVGSYVHPELGGAPGDHSLGVFARSPAACLP